MLLALVVLALASWLLSATTVDGVRSLLSSEGLRYFFGGFVEMLQQPLLIWLLLLSMAYGSIRGSGIVSMRSTLHGTRRHQAIALLTVLTVVYIGIIALLTLTPHAVLLSATGKLWPSPFSRALVPVIAFCGIMLSVVYGFMSRRFLTLSDVCRSLADGIAEASPLLLLYVLGAQLYGALCFVFV